MPVLLPAANACCCKDFLPDVCRGVVHLCTQWAAGFAKHFHNSVCSTITEHMMSGLMCRARANGAASMGKYKVNANGRSLGHTESLHEKDYKY